MEGLGGVRAGETIIRIYGTKKKSHFHLKKKQCTVESGSICFISKYLPCASYCVFICTQRSGDRVNLDSFTVMVDRVILDALSKAEVEPTAN